MKTARSTTRTFKRVRNKPERFSSFVRRIRNEKRLSLVDVSKRSALFGMRISGSYINRIERNPKLNPSTYSLKALALGLGVPVDEVLTRAMRPLTRDEAEELSFITRYRELSSKSQRLVADLIEHWHSQDSTKAHAATPGQGLRNLTTIQE